MKMIIAVALMMTSSLADADSIGTQNAHYWQRIDDHEIIVFGRADRAIAMIRLPITCVVNYLSHITILRDVSSGSGQIVVDDKVCIPVSVIELDLPYRGRELNEKN